MKRLNCRRGVRGLAQTVVTILALGVIGAVAQDERPDGQDREMPPRQQRGRDTQERMADLKNRLNDARADGQEEEAQEIQQQLRRLRSQEQQYQPRPRPNPDRPMGDRRGREDTRNPELERRLQHIRIAVENLHAAGLHEPAERLSREAERIRNEMVQQRAEGGQPRVQAELEELRKEIRRLHEALGDLREQVERLSKQHAQPGSN